MRGRQACGTLYSARRERQRLSPFRESRLPFAASYFTAVHAPPSQHAPLSQQVLPSQQVPLSQHVPSSQQVALAQQTVAPQHASHFSPVGCAARSTPAMPSAATIATRIVGFLIV
jgi:hypothetical protein